MIHESKKYYRRKYLHRPYLLNKHGVSFLIFRQIAFELDSIYPNKDNQFIQARLTALWALAESGLGGYMHAMKIPFTGIFVGGSAVILLSLMAWHSPKPFKTIIRATLLVLLVKFSVSPHTSFPAYLAVSFQGLLAAAMLSLPISRLITLPLFIIIAMLESALQKFILSTLLFGKDLWTALDESALKMASELGISESWATDFSLKLVLIYCLIYAVWGLLLSYFAIILPKLLESKSAEILVRYESLSPPTLYQQKKKRKSWAIRMVGILFVLLFIGGTYFIQFGQDQAMQKALLLLIRTALVLVIYLWALSPILRWILKRLSSSKKNTQAISEIMNELPVLKRLLPAAWKLTEGHGMKMFRFPKFILNLIVLGLYAKQDG